MSFLERLEYLMKKHGIKNNSELSKLSGVPYTTIDGFYKKGYDNVKLSTLRKLSACLDCSIDYLVDDAPVGAETAAAHFDGSEYTPEQLDRIREFAKFVKQQEK